MVVCVLLLLCVCVADAVVCWGGRCCGLVFVVACCLVLFGFCCCVDPVFDVCVC